MSVRESLQQTGLHISQVAILVIVVLLGACRSEPDVVLVDPDATYETKALFANLQRMSGEYVLFGHQDDLAYGTTWKRERGRSDVKEVTGAYPAVYGWELAGLENLDAYNIDSVNFAEMKEWMKVGFERGGVITASWHMDNPATGSNAWDTTRAIHTVLTGGRHHAMYVDWLDHFAAFVSDLNTGFWAYEGLGTKVPIIFRPFHEHTGSWFWWGGRNVDPEEYKKLWRFTVTYLRDRKGIHNLLYAYSTNRFASAEEYFRHYPGDEFVDILGFDDYWSLGADSTIEDMTEQMRFVAREAAERGKLAALTETGFEQIPYPNWWTERLLASIQADTLSRQIVYALVWRNAIDRPNHYYAPYPGHPSAPDFVKFYQDPFVLFEDGLPDLYEWKP